MKLIDQIRSHKLCKDTSGYNLLMSSIALIVTGIILVSAMQAYVVYKKKQDMMKTQQVVANAVDKIQTFKETFGRYPCPSSLNAARNSAAYGAEDCNTVITAGTCAGGICNTTGRTIAAVVQPVRTGGIPFRLLQIDERDAYDAYGSRLVYSMSTNQGSTTTYRDGNGAIGLVDEVGQNLTSPADSADYVVISNGPNKLGGYNVDGVVTGACVAGNLETRNCIDMATAPTSPTRFASSQAYLGGTATNFDDTIEYFATNVVARWRRNDANRDDIQTISNANVGVGTATPGVMLEVTQANSFAPVGTSVAGTWQGGLRVIGTDAGGRSFGVNADTICDVNGANCFRPENFASSGISSCPAGTYFTGLEGNGTDVIARCEPIRVYCNPPSVLTGLDASGRPICSTVSTNCALADVQVCHPTHASHDIRSSNEGGITHPTPTSSKPVPDAGAGVHNVQYDLFDTDSYASNRAYARFTCNNGNWIKTGAYGGLCSCNPTLPPSNIDCTVAPISPSCTGSGACAGFATGATVITYNFNVPACQWQASGPAAIGTCTCPAAGGAPPATVACPGGYNTGSQIPGWNWNNDPSVCNWAAQPSTCACDPSMEVPPTTNGATRPGPGTIACSALPGFAGHTGTATEIQRFNGTAGACGWYFDSWDTSACSCDTTTTFYDPAPSTCNASCQNETVAAQQPYQYVMPGCVRNNLAIIPSTCVPKVFLWKPDPPAGSLSNQSSHGPIEKDSACNTNCMVTNVVGSMSACWEPDTPGYRIHTCICTAQ